MPKLKAKPAWPHQRETTNKFKLAPCGYDASDPGTGKTRAHGDAWAESSNPKRLLVVAPKTLMKTAWQADLREFIGARVGLAYADDREGPFKDLRNDVVVINTDGVKWLAKNPHLLKNFDRCVIDEITAFKHHGSQRSKAMREITKAIRQCYGLSGTPNPKSVTELWHQILLIDGGKRLRGSFFHFRNIMQFAEQVGPRPEHRRWHDRPGADLAVREMIADITIRHAFEDVMKDVPPNHVDTKAYTPNAKTMKIYNQLAANARILLAQGDVTAVHAASLRTKLLQVASGAVYMTPEDDGKSKYEVIDRQRYELIGDLVEERDHSVTFFMWKHQRDELVREFEKRDLRFAVIDGATPQRERDAIVVRYQGGEYQTLLMHPQTGAHGLTLTRGTTTIIASPLDRADLLKQAIHRVYRGGQTQVTNTLIVKAEGTLEEKVYGQLFDKTDRMVSFLELLEEL